MIDPLSTIASVIAVSTAALQSAQILLQLIDGIRNAPDEIAAISNDTHAFYDIVASLEASLKDNDVVSVVGEDNAMVAMVANIELPLRNCSATLGQLMLKVQGRIKPSNDGKGSKFTSGAQWYFRKKDIKDLLDRLGQNKATLNAALNIISAFCQFRLIATSGQEPEDWSSVINGCGSMGTDVGFALDRYIQGNVGQAFLAPSSPVLNPDTRSQLTEDSEPSSDNESLNQNSEDGDPPPRSTETSNTLEGSSQKTADEMPALHKAAKDGDELSVSGLLSHGADVNEKDKFKKATALHWAARHGNESVIRILLRHGADVNAKTFPQDSGINTSKCGGEKTALHWAAGKGYERIVQLLIDSGADVSARSTTLRTPLHHASAKGSCEAAKVLMRNSALLDTQDILGWTPLHNASSGYDNGTARYDKLKARELLEIGKCLLDHGANIEATTISPIRFGSYTPLLLAVKGGFIPMTQLLVDRGANLQARDRSGWPALCLAAVLDYGAIIRILLEAGFDAGVKIDDRELEKVLNYAARNGDMSVLRLLLQRGLHKPAEFWVVDEAVLAAQHCGRGEAAEYLTENFTGRGIEGPVSKNLATDLSRQIDRKLYTIPEYDIPVMISTQKK